MCALQPPGYARYQKPEDFYTFDELSAYFYLIILSLIKNGFFKALEAQ
jgi:hypothetical protein